MVSQYYGAPAGTLETEMVAQLDHCAAGPA